MKSLLAIPLIVLGMTTAAFSQGRTPDNAATSSTSAVNAASPSQDLSLIALAAARPSLAALSFATPALAPSVSSASPAAAASPSPALPKPPYGYKERDYNLEIALGVSVIRFRSSVYDATGVGFHSAGAFFFNNWLAVEAAVSTGFAPTIFAGEHIKVLTYGAGPKISFGRRRLEPWVHVLGGGIHAVPQTGFGGKNGFEVTTGGGADYGLNPRLSLRLESDYVGSRLFAQWQSSFQGIAAIVVHF